MLFYSIQAVFEKIQQVQFGGISSPTFELYYVNTSAMWFLIFVSVALILALISIGSRIGTGSHTPPLSTPLFLLFYSFLAPLWLCAAVVRALFKTGVQWR